MSKSNTPTAGYYWTIPPEPACSLNPPDHETLLPYPIIPNTPRGEDYIAPVSSTPGITRAISNACKIRTALIIKRRRLHDILERLEYEETYIDYYIRSHQAVLSQSALRRMPVELLVEIFKFVLFAVGVTRDTEPVIVSKRLFGLTWVCQRWRYVILNAPILWSTFSVSAANWPQTSFPTTPFMLPPILAAYLDRSRKTPLNISINCTQYTPHHPIKQIGIAAAFFELRYKSLHLIHWGTTSTLAQEGEFQLPLSALETLIVDCTPNHISGFPELPHLKALTISLPSAHSGDWMPKNLGSAVPWWSLASLTIDGSVSTLLSLLPFTTSLVELIAKIDKRSEGPVPSDTIHLRRLRRLTVSVNEGHSTPGFPPRFPSAHDGQKQVRLIREFISHIYPNELVCLSFPNTSVVQICTNSTKPLPLYLTYIRSIRTSMPRWSDPLDFVETQTTFFSENTVSLKSLEVTSLPGATLGAYGVRTLYSLSTSQFSHSLTSFSIRYLDFFFLFEDLLILVEHPQLLESIQVDFVAEKCGEFSSIGERGCSWVWYKEEVEEKWHGLCGQVRALQRTKAKGLHIRMSLRSLPSEETPALVY